LHREHEAAPEVESPSMDRASEPRARLRSSRWSRSARWRSRFPRCPWPSSRPWS